MVDKNTLNSIYNITPSNLECYLNPDYKTNIRFLSDEEMVNKAKNIIELIVEGNSSTILYSETGAFPLSYICSHMGGKSWFPIKCPRDAVGNYEKIILFLLTKEEKESFLSKNNVSKIEDFCKINNLRNEVYDTCNREQLILRYKDYLNQLFIDKTNMTLSDIFSSLGAINITHKLFELILEGTVFSNLLLSKVTYVDEYIDSGTTLYNTFNVLKCFNPSLKFNIVSYYVFSNLKYLDNNTIKSVYSKDDGINAFFPGAYPYENRLDIIGHFYLIEDDVFKKIDIYDLYKEYGLVSTEGLNTEIESFFEHCLSFINNSNILKIWKEKYQIKEVANLSVVNEYQIIRYLLYLFENRSKDSPVITRLLWDLFDMHGPAWSPLPDNYHIEFWLATELLEKDIILMKDFIELEIEYKRFRKQILRDIIDICYKRNKNWKDKIDIIINNQKK